MSYPLALTHCPSCNRLVPKDILDEHLAERCPARQERERDSDDIPDIPRAHFPGE